MNAPRDAVIKTAEVSMAFPMNQTGKKLAATGFPCVFVSTGIAIFMGTARRNAVVFAGFGGTVVFNRIEAATFEKIHAVAESAQLVEPGRAACFAGENAVKPVKAAGFAESAQEKDDRAA
jgi:hypothetical protein